MRIKYKDDQMKIALVCSHGGHLTEMQNLIEAFQGHDIFFVTYDSIRTRKLPHQKYLLDNIGKNPIKMSIAFLKFLNIFRKERPDIVVSTGAEIAIPAFYIAKIFRAKTIFIECWCRVKTSSATGNSVYPVADIFLVQWQQLLKVYGKKAQYQGSVVR
jgi:beta-1,4-N-acetylglucosaminyltransferase